MSTAEQEARQMIADKKAAAAAEKAYNAASSTPPAPAKPPAQAASAPKPKRSPMVEASIQEAEDEKMRQKIKKMGYAKGGSVSASRRADGIAKKGKTRGTFC